MSLFTSNSGLIGVIIRLTLILFIITGSHCSPILNHSEDHIDNSVPELLTSRSTSDNNPFPTVFDTLGSNFTAPSCPAFFKSFLANETFQSCHAVSLLLQNSNTFFKDLASAVTLDQVLDTSCSANVTKCASYMSTLATNLTNSNNCGGDYMLGNPIVTQAYDGMASFEPIAQAACLKDPSTQEYCMTEAALNSTDIADYYLYFLPLGNMFPGGGRPSCNPCTQATMAVFQNYAVIKDNPLVQTYTLAAQTINVGCGPNFVNATVNVGSQSPPSGTPASASILNVTPPSLTTLLGYTLTICLGLILIL